MTLEFFFSTELFVIAAICGVVAIIMLGAYGLIGHRQDLIGRLPHAARGLGAAAVAAVVLLAYPIWFTFAGPAHLSGRVWPSLTPGGGGLSPNGLWHLTFQNRGLVQLLSGYSGSRATRSRVSRARAAGGARRRSLVVWRRDRRLWLFGGLGVASVLLSLGVNTGSWVPWQVLARIPVVQNALPARGSWR